MHDEFGMSMMGELNFFLGLQIKQMDDGIFFNHSKYIKEMLKKFGLEDSKPMKTPMSSDTKLTKDEECADCMAKRVNNYVAAVCLLFVSLCLLDYFLDKRRLEVNDVSARSRCLACTGDKRSYLLSFIRTADPTKVRIGERHRAEDEPKLLDTTVGRVVPLLPIAPARAESELDASVDKLLDENGSGNQAKQGDSASGRHSAGIQLVSEDAETVVEYVTPMQPKCQKKRKTVIIDAGEPSHPAKRLRDDHETPSGPTIGGESRSLVQCLLVGAVKNAEVRGEAMPTLLFATSFVSTTPEHEGGDHTKSLAGADLRTIGAPQVDFVVRTSMPIMTSITTTTPTDDPAVIAKEKLVGSFVFGADSSSAGGSHPIPVYVPQWNVTNGSCLDDGGFCREMMSLSAEVRMRAEYNIKEKRRLKSVVDEQTELLKFEFVERSLLDEAQVLKECNTTLEKEKSELEIKVADLAASVKVREHEVADLDDVVTSVKSRNDSLVDQVHGLEISSAGLQEKVTAYESFIDQIEKFQDDKMKEVNDKFDQVYTDFIEMPLHLEEKFYLHLLTTISGRRWLLTYGMELAIAKYLNSTKYLSTLEAAIGKTVEKGMQDGLSAKITHGAEGRNLTDVATSNKDARVEMIMNLLRLDDTLAEKLGLTESQPHVNQLMVPIYRSPDQTVVGATALSALCDVFIPLADPLSSVALEGMKCTSGTAPVTTTALFVTFASVSSIPPILTDDYEVVHADGQEGVGADANPFPNVDDAELNIHWFPSRSLNLYAPFPSASVTSYGPFHLGPNFPVSSVWLSLLLWYTRSPALKLVLWTLELSRLISRASLFCAGSTSAVLSVGMPIYTGMTTSVPYVNENGVSPLLDFIIFLTTILERIVLELLSIIRDNFSWKSKSANNVVLYEFFDLVASNRCNRFCFNPLREVVDGYYQKFDFPRPFRKMSRDVNSSLVEQPWRCDWA
ncbi:gypsy type transposase [Tanacetum coccineum]